MSFSYRLIAAVLASLPLTAAAQVKSHHTDPADANVTVPASTYDSAFKSYQAATDEKQSPDKAWRAANDEVRSLGGHAGHIKGSGNSTTPAAEHQGHVPPTGKGN